jgi:hypothetical protein
MDIVMTSDFLLSLCSIKRPSNGPSGLGQKTDSPFRQDPQAVLLKVAFTLRKIIVC